MAPLDERLIFKEQKRKHSHSGVRRLYRTAASIIRIRGKRNPAEPESAVRVQRWRRALRLTSWVAATVFLTLLLGVLYVSLIGITIDASFLRERIAQTFSDGTGRAVRFDGALEIVVSARPGLRVGGLEIANPTGFGGGTFASLGEARLNVDLWPLLLQRQLRVDELAGKDVTIRLQSKPDGSNNWTLHRPRASAAPETDRAPTLSAEQVVALLDIRQIALRDVNVEYINAANESHFFDLHSLEAQSPVNAPLNLVLDGTVEKRFPYSLALTGGALSELATDKPWPLAFTVSFLSTTLSVTGTVDGAGRGNLAFGLGSENLEEFERLLQTELPDVGVSGIAATVDFSPRHVSIKQLAGAMGDTTLTGDLNFDMNAPRPRLTGALIAKTLDLRPFVGERQSTGGKRIDEAAVTGDQGSAPPRNLAELYRSLASASFDLRRLNDIDADVTLGVERWLSLPGEVKNVRLQIQLANGVLRAPLTATMAHSHGPE